MDLQDGLDKAFVLRSELRHIPEDAQVPPEWVSRSKYYCFKK